MKNLNEETARELLNELSDYYKTEQGSGSFSDIVDRFLTKKFHKHEVGHWHKSKHLTDKELLCFEKEVDGTFYFYGFDSLGTWHNDIESAGLIFEQALPATRKEVEQALKAEYKRLGGTGELDFSLYWDKNSKCYLKQIFNERENLVFNSGKWAEIIPDKEEKEEMTLDQIEKELKKLAKSVRQLRNNL